MRLLLLIPLLMVVRCIAATYHVDAGRPDDLGDGLTFATAWKTVAKVNTASASFLPGDSVLFDAEDEWPELLNPATSGSAGNYITFGRYGNTGRPTFRAAAGRPSAVTLVPGRTHIKLSFLNLVGGDAAEADGLLESDSITNLSEDCTFDGEGVADNCAGGSITMRRFYITGADDDGFTQHQTNDALLEDGEITGNTQGINNSATNATLTVNRVYIHDNTNGEIAPLSATTATFTACKIKGSVKLFDGATLPVIFRHCLFDGSGSGSAVAPEFNTTALTTVENCTFYANGKGKIGISNAPCNFVNTILANWNIAANLFTGGTFNKDHCITFNVTSGSVTSNTNAVTGDPLFVNAAGGDFRLQAESPAINAGTNLGLTTDLAGRAVSNPPDIGAYEFFVASSTFTGSGSTSFSGSGTTIVAP